VCRFQNALRNGISTTDLGDRNAVDPDARRVLAVRAIWLVKVAE
jgi:hypothetical protein